MGFRIRLCLIFFTWTGMGTIITYAQSTRWKEWDVRGDTLFNHGDYKKAIRSYSKAINLSKLKDKDAYRTVYKRAVSYYSAGDHKNALKDLDIFIPEYPQVSQARLLKAFIYRELGDDDQQLIHLEAAMELRPPGPDLLKWRGLLYLQKDEYAKAKMDFVQASVLQDDAEVETYLGLCYHNSHLQDSAMASLNRSIELDATYLPAYLYAGSACLENEAYDLGLQYINLALRLDPGNKEAMFYKGVALIELQKINEGCRCLNRAFYAGMDEAGDYLKEYCFGVED